ncbi:sulfotransferase family protein [Mycobacterium sp.]|uniref:sulfotransferase family protein n=1 Tax=Mycobacterium sp. TaxID=1785 RepID=UPI003BB1AC1E
MAAPDDEAGPFDLAALLAAAQRKESLTDWGPGYFERPLGVLLDDYARADLNVVGVHILRSGIVHSLRMRLRAQEWIRRHPEILEEPIAAPTIVVGMMRSGTTLLQRLLAADPRFNCAYGWEVVEAAPRLDHQFTGIDPRIAVSEVREAKSRELAPDLFVIHPMYAREAEEEIVFLADAFLSHVPESGAHLPHYRSWLDAQDFTPAYDYLHRMLQFLQWQKRKRGQVATRWVLKSPAHLGYLDALRARFGDLHIVHLHRDPRATIASGASLNATLHAMHADRVDRQRVGAQWLQRMGWTNDRAMVVRDQWDSEKGSAADRFTDIGFDDAVDDPIGQVARVYDAINLPLTVEAESAMRRWLAERPREAARPAYALHDYGLHPEQVDERFTLYNKRFEQYVGK